MKNLSAIRLGVFITIGTALLILAIFLVGNKESLFSSTYNVKAYFKTIEGLRSGAPVRLSGIDVGSVSNIRIIADTTGSVEVIMRLRTEIAQFIKTDTRATIETEGLVGNKVIMLSAGSAGADQIKEGGTIQSRDPLGFAAIIAETQGTMFYVKEMTRSLSEIITRVNEGEGTIGKFLNDETLYNNAANLTKNAELSLNALTSKLDDLATVITDLSSGVEGVLKNVDNVVVEIDHFVTNINQGKGLLGKLTSERSNIENSVDSLLNNLVVITKQANEGMTSFADNMEALKYNWLFKSYFEQQGYFDNKPKEVDLYLRIRELMVKIQDLESRIETLKNLEEDLKKKNKTK